MNMPATRDNLQIFFMPGYESRIFSKSIDSLLKTDLREGVILSFQRQKWRFRLANGCLSSIYLTTRIKFLWVICRYLRGNTVRS